MADARLNRSLRVTYLGLAVNALLTGVKFTAGVLGHSQALIADAVESMADIFGSLVVWRGLVVAAEPADEDHPYGHGKAEPLAAAGVSIMLLIAAGWIAVESLQQIRMPQATPAPFTLVVLGLVILVKETLFRFVLSESISVQSSAVKSDAWHHRSDAITSGAAAIGISISLMGGEAFAAADDYAAIFAAGIIAWNGLRLLRPAVNELMDRAPDADFIAQVRSVANSTQGVEGVEKCIVRKMGYHYFVDIHIEVDPDMTVLHSHYIAHAVKDAIRAEMSTVYDVLVHIEPTRPTGQGGST